jgi:hypothetical protein
MTVALLVFGGLGTPVAGLLIRPDVRGARHGLVMFVDLGRFGWYGYLAVSVVVLAAGVAGVVRGTAPGRRRAIGAAGVLLALTAALGTVHVIVLATGVFHGESRPLLAALAALAGVAAVLALVLARARLRRAG